MRSLLFCVYLGVSCLLVQEDPDHTPKPPQLLTPSLLNQKLYLLVCQKNTDLKWLTTQGSLTSSYRARAQRHFRFSDSTLCVSHRLRIKQISGCFSRQAAAEKEAVGWLFDIMSLCSMIILISTRDMERTASERGIKPSAAPVRRHNSNLDHITIFSVCV